MLDWMKLKLESRLQGKIINNLRYTDDTTLMAESEEELRSLWMNMKEECAKSRLEAEHSDQAQHDLRKLRSWHLVPSLHGKWMGKLQKQ